MWENEPLQRIPHLTEHLNPQRYSFTLHILDGGDRGRIQFIIDHKAQTARIEWCNRKPHLDTTVQIARRLWYLFAAQGFREIMPNDSNFG